LRQALTREPPMAHQALHHRQRRIGPRHSRVKRCRSIKDRNRLWKVGVRALVRDIWLCPP
jgi:hypothetical protein